MKFYIAGNRKNPGGYYDVSFWKWIFMWFNKRI